MSQDIGINKTIEELTLTDKSINFGKYKGKQLKDVLRDREYCMWLKKQDWFMVDYEYLYNKISTIDPTRIYIQSSHNLDKDVVDKENSPEKFMSEYVYFNLTRKLDEKIYTEFVVTDTDKICYDKYICILDDLKSRIQKRIDKEEDNVFDIKAPTNWLIKFEKDTSLSRSVFKEFISAYELPNITSLVEHIKVQGGIDYKGARSFKIAKENSEKQEKFWYDVLKQYYISEDVSFQYKFEDCYFDFLVINKEILFECKLGINDFNDDQFAKYNIALTKYKVIYLISDNCIIDFKRKILYSTDLEKYMLYMVKMKKITNYLEEAMKTFDFVRIQTIQEGLGKISE